MQEEGTRVVWTEDRVLESALLERTVTITCFLPKGLEHPEQASLLLINDGQDMEKLGLASMLDELLSTNQIEPLVCVAIHTGKERKSEYGTARCPDYMDRGRKAGAYSRFIFEELLPFIYTAYGVDSFKNKSFAGFSLGGLSALDIVWNHPGEFLRVGVFSGSLWWRMRGLDDGYDETTDRIMHRQIKEGGYYPWLKFFFEVGTLDETMDRNQNGIIDAIDDTVAIIDDLVARGYDRQKDIFYLELQEGRHDVASWAKAMPVFLKWGWAVQ